ncbi:hypothetical protein [Paraburkholderia sp. BL17N1]|uniref:hypothetical protein n=1 Tax=Paraburkholderia sp. BL17N1 TaxID=1938798 RepID=UPI000F1809FE|nr:hypothetical protein [Paraburkholderia sp. BL17N1]RKR42864.1 hypothetical protein B0G82_0411 [Paraburkholderia sp. BL17N1]
MGVVMARLPIRGAVSWPIACLVAVLGFLSMSLAYGKACTEHDAVGADAMVDSITTWDAASVAFTKYGQCDDGDIAEGYSEAIARLLVDRWNTLPRLGQLIKRNPSLKGFVLRHIDSTLDTADLDKIKGLSTSSCPSGMETFCKALTHAVLQTERPAK